MPLAYILFNYISRGKVNHIVTFSEFLRVINILQGDKTATNWFVFRLITENNRDLSLLQLLRQYVCTPKGSLFAKELLSVIDYYNKMYLDDVPGGPR